MVRFFCGNFLKNVPTPSKTFKQFIFGVAKRTLPFLGKVTSPIGPQLPIGPIRRNTKRTVISNLVGIDGLAAARSRSGSDTAPRCHSLPSRRFATAAIRFSAGASPRPTKIKLCSPLRVATKRTRIRNHVGTGLRTVRKTKRTHRAKRRGKIASFRVAADVDPYKGLYNANGTILSM